MRNKKRFFAVMLTAAVAACVFSGCSGRGTVALPDYQTELSGLAFSEYTGAAFTAVSPTAAQQTLLAGFKETNSSEFLTLYYNETSASVAVFDLRSGKLWFSNDPLVADDTKIDSASLGLFQSQLYIDYIDGQNSKQIDSYTLSVSGGTFSSEVTGDGLSVTYHFMDNAGEEETGGTVKELFGVTVDYTLTEESLIVSVPVEKISYQKNTQPLQITLLPHFGACTNASDGYLFVPDGSGALICYDDAKFSTHSYYGMVYGIDESLDLKNAPLNTEQVTMPVFGVKDGNNAFVAIIEDGAAIAAVNANRAGAFSSYNEVYPSFSVFSSQIISIGDLENASKTYGAQATPYEGSLRVRYSFLDSSHADYSGMACYYRDYLSETAALTKQEAEAAVPLQLELIGAIDKLKSTLGIRYTGTVSLTTTQQAEAILAELQEQGVTAINLRYTGWMNGGLKQELPVSVHPVGAIGGKKGIAALADYTAKNNIGFYPSASLLTAVDGSSGFSKFSMAARQIDQKEAKSYVYDTVTTEQGDFSYILSPASLDTVFEKFLRSYDKLHLDSLCLSDIATRVNADYTNSQVIDRETAVNLYKKQLSGLSEQVSSLMLSTGNAYAVPYADTVLNAPFSDSGFDVIDRSVPFYQIVFHGTVDYAGSPINLSYDYDTDVLKTIEYGGTPYYQLMAADGSAVKNTDYDTYCSSSYDVWKKDIADTWKSVNGALAQVSGCSIVKHEMLSDGVYATTYDNGVCIYVNYNGSEYTTGGITVPAGGYTTGKGAAE